ncbi:hypothetical protein ACFP1I_22345 [Dyadobacter subterraneus]|uniref:Uncharacterized protein n=1 Tax=Dyadobacter subterraneus TaxID=2773304 RepID=A0ABR9WIZ6_9BACT|nr:hypothetical protein [Dyadobacter subterraneus]MBE9465494.1 hypothetical protein [Dyadobacter subterraneus]
MKTILTILISLLGLNFFAQSTNNVIPELGNYFWKERVTMELVEIDGTSKHEFVESKNGQLFRVIKHLNGTDVILKIIDYKDPLSGDGLVYNTYGVKPSDAANAAKLANAAALAPGGGA